jgi:flagellar biosynthesis GTPase FlhF
MEALNGFASQWLDAAATCPAKEVKRLAELLSTTLAQLQGSDIAVRDTWCRLMRDVHDGWPLLARLRLWGQEVATRRHEPPSDCTAAAPEEGAWGGGGGRSAEAIISLSMAVMNQLDRRRTEALLRCEALSASAARRIQARFRGSSARAEMQRREKQRQETYRQAMKAAAFIQRLIRRRAARKEAEARANEAARGMIKWRMRRKMQARRRRNFEQQVNRAATVIQGWVRAQPHQFGTPLKLPVYALSCKPAERKQPPYLCR